MFGRVQTKIRKLYFSTDIQMEAKEIIDYYRTRFQIEFCYRDGKQFIGLTDCQSRDLNKLHFHFNASLTSVNLAKVKAIEKGSVLSMVSVKVLCHNIFLMQRFISVLGIKPNEEINRRLWEEGIKFAAIAAQINGMFNELLSINGDGDNSIILDNSLCNQMADFSF